MIATNPKRTLRSTVRTFLPAMLAVALVSGCSAEAKKTRHLDRAEKYFKAGEYEKAKIEYLNVLRAEPQNATACQRMGAIWMEQGAPLRAGGFLVKAREISPNDMANRLTLTRLYISVGAFAEARKEAESILVQSPANGDAVRLLVEASRTPEDLAAAGQRLQNFTAKDNISFQLASATLALKRGDAASAENAVQNALRQDPASTLAHTAMAAVHLVKKDLVKATEEFKLAAESSPLRSPEHIQYAAFQARTGASKEAIASLKAITAGAPDYLPAWRLLAQIALDEKRYDEGLELLANVFKYDPDNAEGRIVEAQIFTAKGEGAKAVQALQRLDTAYPKVPMIKLQLARASLVSNDRAGATAALNDALAVDPENIEAKIILAGINLQAGDAPAVVTSMTDVLKKQPGIIQAELLLAEAYRLLGRLDEAAGIFRGQISASPQNASAFFGLGVILRQQNKTGEAGAAFEKAAELAPENLLALNYLVEMDLAAKDFPGALQRAERQLEKTPNSAETHLLQGKIYAVQQDWDRAEKALFKALELNPNMQSSYETLVTVYLSSNKLPQAVSQLEAFLTKQPKNQGARVTLGMIYSQMKNYQKARDVYEQVLADQPDVPLALNNLAYLYSEQFNELEKASECAAKAHSLEPANPRISDTFGWILYKRGDYERSVTLLSESAGKLPDSAEVQFHLGMASYMAGQTTAARTALEKAVKSPVDFPGKEEARRRMALLNDETDQSTAPSLTDLQESLKTQPNDVVALMRLGEKLESDGLFPKAAESFEKAVQLNPKLMQAILKLAQLYAGPLQNSGKAFELAKKARELAPADARVAGVVGRIAYDTGNFAWSYSLLQESARRGTADAETLHGYAWSAYSQGKISEAQAAMEKALAATPDARISEDAKSFMAMTKTGASASPNATDVEQVLETKPDYVPALVVRAASLSQRAPDQAIAVYSSILRKFPDFAPAKTELAALYSTSPENRDKAYELASTARKALPNDARLAHVLARICFERKEFSRAIQLLQESSRQEPLDALALYYLGMSQLASKQDAAARESLKKALEAGLPTAEASEVNRALAEADRR